VVRGLSSLHGIRSGPAAPGRRRGAATALLVFALWLAPAAADEIGDASAAYRRADYETALRLARPLAEQGNARAQELLGLMHDLGRGVTQDHAEAAQWYRKAAEQGLRVAQFNLGYLYGNGRGVIQDYREAAAWYRKSADQGHASAQNNLAILYFNGQGVAQDYAEAFRLYRLAAQKKNANSMHGLGLLYFRGRGTPQDYREAARWWRLAVAEGEAKARVGLGDLYANGHGVSADPVRAHMWYGLAADALAGNDQQAASNKRDAAAKKLSAAELDRAQDLAKRCAASKFKDCGEPGEEPPKDSPPQVAAAPVAAGLTPDQVYRLAAPSVYIVVAAPSAEDIVQKKSGLSQGSAVALTPELAVTNCHVIKDHKAVFLYVEKQAGPATVERVDQRADICLLRSTQFKLAPIAGVRRSTEVSIGERAYAIGAPRFLERTLTEGLVSAMREDKGVRLLQTTAAIAGGSSGGGLFDAQGRLIGITTRGIKEEGFLNFAVATDEFWPLGGAAAPAQARRPQSAAAPARAADALPPLAAEPGSEVQCGFLKVEGLPIQKPSVKCELGKRQHSATASEGRKAVLAATLPGRMLVLDAEKDEGNNGYKPSHSDFVRENFQRWAASRNGRNISALIEQPFRHFKLNATVSGEDGACFYGIFTGDKKGRAGEPVHYAWIMYCEKGTHTVSDEMLSTLRRAVRFD
jgi:TPR repeat protein